MATIRVDFDSYKIWYYSAHSYEALIYVYKDRKYVGRIVFFKDDAAIPPNASYPAPSIHYPLSRFDHVVGILREEKPLYLHLNLSNKIGTLATADIEPTGEEEGV
ncbi:MAG TPA: hypothetical protein ENL01_00175 [Chlorobaculum parvum]|uniref:Uncharacterized protein n=1 Tax=Chlorobaculum parvum TaxID=274539 RepID=A0A7C5H6A6_9CHLB|nr:hypothetical protein [Chlorobaculum parvum]